MKGRHSCPVLRASACFTILLQGSFVPGPTRGSPGGATLARVTAEGQAPGFDAIAAMPISMDNFSFPGIQLHGSGNYGLPYSAMVTPPVIGNFTAILRISDGCNVVWLPLAVAASCSTPVLIDSFAITDVVNVNTVAGSVWNGTAYTPVLISAYLSGNAAALPLFNVNWTVLDAAGAVLPASAISVQPGSTGPLSIIVSPRSAGAHTVLLSFDDGCTGAASSVALPVFCGPPPLAAVTAAAPQLDPSSIASTLNTSAAGIAAELAAWSAVTVYATSFWNSLGPGIGLFAPVTIDASGSSSVIGNPLSVAWTVVENTPASYDANGGLAASAMAPETDYAGASAIAAAGAVADVRATTPGVRRVLIGVSDGCTTTPAQALVAFLCTPPAPVPTVLGAPTAPLVWSWSALAFAPFTVNAGQSTDGSGVPAQEQGSGALVSWDVSPPLSAKSTMTGPSFRPTFTLREGGSWVFTAIVSDGCYARNTSFTVTAACPDSTFLVDGSPANSLASPLQQASLFQGGRFDPVVLGELVRRWGGRVEARGLFLSC